MKKKIITIERQYGSGGSEIGKLVAQKLGIEYYNREILEITSKKCDIAPDKLENAEENVPTSFLYSLMLASNFSKSYDNNLPLSDRVFLIESQVIKEIGCFGVFIYGDKEKRIERAIKDYGIDPKKAEAFLKKTDKRREVFYNTNSDRLWQDKEQYMLCLNSSELGDELCAEIIVNAFKKYCEKE